MFISLVLLSVVLLSASVAFAASDNNVTAEVNNEIAVDEDVLTVEEDTAVLQADETPAAENAVVTNDTFYQYFDTSGTILSNVTSDELIFEGDFTGVGVNYISIDKPIKFTGNNATFSGVVFAVAADNVTIDGFDITLDNNDVYAITVGSATNVTISNNVIDYRTLDGFDGYAIFADTVDYLKLLNNTIMYVGTSDGSTINTPIRVSESEGLVIYNNDITAIFPTGAGNVIDIAGCSDSYVVENHVEYDYNGSSVGYNSIFIVYVEEDCNDVFVSDNAIFATGGSYTYGISAYGTNFTIDDNYLVIVSDVYYACGINPDCGASGVVSNNNVTVKAPTAVYGVYSGMWTGFSPVAVDYVNNTIEGVSFFACGIELGGAKENASGNHIDLYGNFTMGIAVYKYGQDTIDTTICDNIINLEGTNIGDATSVWDSVGVETAGIKITAGNVTVSGNKINSTAGGIYLAGDEIDLINNSIEVETNAEVKNYAISAIDLDKLLVENNYVDFKGYTNGTAVSNAMLVDGIDNPIIKNNSFAMSLVSARVNWVGWDKYPVSEGVVFKNSQGAVFEGNRVAVVYNNVVGDDDTIYVVDVLNSPNSVISSNNIVAHGHKYIYGIIVTSTNFTIENNTIFSVSDYYCAYAVNPDFGASGVVKNNTLAAIAPDIVYTIYSYATDVDYIANQVYGRAYYVNVLDIGGTNENIINNTIIASGNYTVAVNSYSSNNTISGNIIRALGSNQGNKTVPYIYSYVTEAIYIDHANATITDNYLESTGQYAVDLSNTNSNLENNYIIANKLVGVNAIANAGSSVLVNITPGLKTVLAAVNLHGFYDDGDVFYVCALDEYGDPIAYVNITLTFNNGMVMKEYTDTRGVAPFYLDIAAGEYSVVASFAGNEVYGPKSISSTISIEPRPVEIDVVNSASVFLTTIKSGYYYKIRVVDYMNIPVAGKSVTITYNGKTYTRFTDEEGIIKFKLSATKVGTQKIVVTFKNSNYTEVSETSVIKITKQATKVIATNKIFKAKAKVKKYTVTLKDSKNKIIKKALVWLSVGGKTLKAYTNAKGQATFNIAIKKVCNLNARVTFKGNAYYTASTKAVKILVRK